MEKQKETPMKYWTVRFGVAQKQVDDGFEMTAQRAKNMLSNELPFAYDHELFAEVTESN